MMMKRMIGRKSHTLELGSSADSWGSPISGYLGISRVIRGYPAICQDSGAPCHDGRTRTEGLDASVVVVQLNMELTSGFEQRIDR